MLMWLRTTATSGDGGVRGCRAHARCRVARAAATGRISYSEMMQGRLQPAPVPPAPRVVEYPTGRYELRGDGITYTIYVGVDPESAAASRRAADRTTGLSADVRRYAAPPPATLSMG